jgi:hypothetical protein
MSFKIPFYLVKDGCMRREGHIHIVFGILHPAKSQFWFGSKRSYQYITGIDLMSNMLGISVYFAQQDGRIIWSKARILDNSDYNKY